MTLGRVKAFWQHISSFFQPQVIRKNVLIAGMDDEDGIEQPIEGSSKYKDLVIFRPYFLDYILVGIEPGRRDPGQVVYRFFDPESCKEFILTKQLVELLFYKPCKDTQGVFTSRPIHVQEHMLQK